MKETLEDYIGPSPQTRIDIDDLLRRSRQIRRRRQSAAACLAGVAVLGVTALGVVMFPREGSPPAPAASASPAPRADRLLKALQTAITREAPQVRGVDGLREYVLQCRQDGKFSRYDKVPAGPGVEPVPCPGQKADGQYLWKGELTSPAGTYGIEVTISPSVYFDPSAPPVDDLDAAERQAAREQGDAPERGPDGEHITLDAGLLNMTKRDGTGIVIMTWDTKKEGAYMTRSPFTADQLKAIGLDPALRY
jgi:hypothetical protein